MPKFDNIISGFWGNTAKNKLIYTFGALAFFFVLFDGIITYLLPLIIVEHGFSKTMLGIILGTAAISGAFFDFTIYKIFKEVIYRRLFILMFALAFVYIFIVWIANVFLLYLVAMAMWGFYYDLKNFGTLDFISRYSRKKDLSTNFGIVQIFQSIGYLLAPLIAGFVIIESVGYKPFILATVFLFVSLFFFIMLIINARGKKHFLPLEEKRPKINFLKEFDRWKKVGLVIFPVLALAAFMALYDSFFMAIGPIFGETLPMEPFDGLFIFAYLLPAAIIGGLVGTFTKKFGEKKTALFGLFLGSAILSTLFFSSSPLIIIVTVFIAACFTSLVSPIIHTIYANYIHQSQKYKKEIQELGDFSSNFGYIIGPITAGFIADKLGNLATFLVLGLMGIFFALILFIFMPKKFSLK